MVKEVKKKEARSEINGSAEVNEGVKRAEDREPAEVEEKSAALSEEEQRTEEIEADEEKPIITPLEKDAPKEIIEEACDESQGNEETIECGENIDSAPFYLQPDKVQVLEKRVVEFTPMVEEESAPAEELPPVIDPLEWCSYERKEEPEWRTNEQREKVARAMNWVQLQPRPELRRMAKPPHSGVRPKGNKKVIGTYRHHRKKWGIKLKGKLKGELLVLSACGVIKWNFSDPENPLDTGSRNSENPRVTCRWAHNHFLLFSKPSTRYA